MALQNKQTLTKTKKQNPKCWGGWREGDPVCAIARNAAWYSYHSMESIPSQSQQHDSCVYTQQASLLGVHTEEPKSLPATAICSPTLTAGFSKVPTMWKECVVDGHMAKICNIFTRECYLALKKECSLAIRLNIDEPGGH